MAQTYWDLNFGKRPFEELYNIKEDPECIMNLAEVKEFADTKNKLSELLVAELKEQDDPRIFGKGDIFDNYEYSDPRTRDFYNRYLKGELNKNSAGWVDSTDFEENDL
jgi:hypothetical protein